MPESSTLLNLRMIAYLLKGIDSGDHTHILSFTFLGGFNAFITLLKIRVMSFLLTDGCLSPKDSIYKTLCPRRANSTVTCCLLVQKDYPNLQWTEQQYRHNYPDYSFPPFF
jgi:hypothetical protein